MPLPLASLREPFDDPAFVFENKWDGFRALAFLTSTGATLVSRNGNPFRRFSPLATALRSVLDAAYSQARDRHELFAR